MRPLDESSWSGCPSDVYFFLLKLKGIQNPDELFWQTMVFNLELGSPGSLCYLEWQTALEKVPHKICEISVHSWPCKRRGPQASASPIPKQVL